MATVCSSVRSDLTAPFKPPGLKHLILKISKKIGQKTKKVHPNKVMGLFAQIPFLSLERFDGKTNRF